MAEYSRAAQMSTLPSHQYNVSLRVRQGLEEAQVSTRSMRRDRSSRLTLSARTAEDLNVTLWKLAKYEELLNEITPLVSQDVRGMIDDIRAQVGHGV